MYEIDSFCENVNKNFAIICDREIAKYQTQKLNGIYGVPIIHIGGGNADLYKSILFSLNNELKRNLIQLIYEILLKEQNKSDSIKKIRDLVNRRDSLEFYDVRNNHKVHAFLQDRPTMTCQEMNKFRNIALRDGDELCIILTQNFDEGTIRRCEESVGKRFISFYNFALDNLVGRRKVTMLNVSEFLLRYYGKEAKKCFEKAVSKLNDELDEIIGYSVTEICSAKMLKKFKAQLRSDWEKFDAETVFNDYNISTETKAKIAEKFLAQKRYNILMNDNIYSDSYVTSEWFYRKYAPTIKTSNFDMTTVVAGYLKSMEQLLDIIILEYGRGKVFKTIGNEEMKVGDNNYKSMLGGMQKFLRGNRDLFEEKDIELQNFYLKKLQIWIDQYRNGYFHKDNISAPEVLMKIRDETLNLYFLTLSLFKV